MTAREKLILIADDDPHAIDNWIGISGFAAARRLRRNPFTHDILLTAAVRRRATDTSRFGGFTGSSIRTAMRQHSHLAMQPAQDNG